MSLKPVGYQHLVQKFHLSALSHFQVSFIAERGQRKTEQQANQQVCEIYPKSYDPGLGVFDQLEFSIKYEGINLEILSKLFEKLDPRSFISYIQSKPTGKYSRILWFLFENFTGNVLRQIPDLQTGRYINLLDPDLYYTSKAIRSRRHRVANNLLGGLHFSPMVRKTLLLEQYDKFHLDKKCLKLIHNYPDDIIARGIQFLYTKETKSSYQIERERPEAGRVLRFIETLKMAGRLDFLNKKSLVGLQNQIVEQRFADSDYRKTQNYVGEAIGLTRETVHYISPQPDVVSLLMEGLIDCHEKMCGSKVPAWIHAAVISFGFVFIHPFEDGNGRIHRFLIHHILAARGYTPEGIIFPVSATLLRKIRKYDETLELFSKQLMPLIQYSLDSDGKLGVQGDTTKFYQYIDMTRICESLFEFLKETVEIEFPAEFDFLVQYDRTKKAMQKILDFPDQKVDQFIKFCIQNEGHLSKSKRDKFFSMITNQEVIQLEEIVRENMILS